MAQCFRGLMLKSHLLLALAVKYLQFLQIVQDQVIMTQLNNLNGQSKPSSETKWKQSQLLDQLSNKWRPIFIKYSILDIRSMPHLIIINLQIQRRNLWKRLHRLLWTSEMPPTSQIQEEIHQLRARMSSSIQDLATIIHKRLLNKYALTKLKSKPILVQTQLVKVYLHEM